MTVKRYLKDHIIGVSYFGTLLTLINVFLFVSTPISASHGDIIYLNLLLVSLSSAFSIWKYYSWKNMYQDYASALESESDLAHFIPQSTSLEAQLIKDTIQFKDKELQGRVENLQIQLEEINEYITQWVHEIKTPIAVCELMSERFEDQDGLRLELERVKFLVDQVLYASRVSSYEQDLIIEEVDLLSVVKDSVKKNATFFIAKRISINLGDLTHQVYTDRKWLTYILGQILNNASKYVDERGKIEICSFEDDKSITLRIRDNGMGIPNKDIQRIFDKGFTGDNGRKTPKSTGMGLYFSKKIIDQLGHSISVSSVPNCFTEFTIVFHKLSEYLKVTKM